MLEPAAASFVNHLLRQADWAREALRPYAGRTARFEGLPLAATFTVLDNGDVAPAAADAHPDVTARFTPGLGLRLAAGDDKAWNDVEISGDTDFAAVIHRLARHLRWDAEEDLSRLFGDITAHRMVQAGRGFREWAAGTFEHAGRTLTEYWVHERPLIASRQDVDELNRGVDRLREDADRLEKRIEALASSRPR